ncbi:MAG: glycoside hydrolase family 9 protein [Bacteroidales bacterium]
MQGCRKQGGELFIRVNQAGYLPGETMSAIIFSENRVTETFSLVSATGEEVLSGLKPEVIKAETWGRYRFHYAIDFGHLADTGKFFMEGDLTGTRSLPFIVSGNTYENYPDLLLGFMRQQRCGYNPFLDIECHQLDGKTMFGPMTDSTFIDVSGGWHDAGDQLKYLITSSYATAHMLKAYELFPDAFSDIVDSGGRDGANGIPDVLDEAKWGLDWIHKMHPSPGTLFHQVADDRDHKGWKMPDNDNSDYGWGENSYRVVYFATGEPQGLREYKSEATGVANLAGRSAAAMAIAYNIWKDDPGMTGFALKCLSAAQTLYEMGRSDEGYQQGNSYGAPYRYSEETWADDMEWGAAELFRATGEEEYLVQAKEYAIMAGTVSWLPHDTAIHYQYYPFVNIGHYVLYDLVDPGFRETLAGYYREGIESAVKRGEENSYNIGVPFIWCSNNLLAGLVTQLILYEMMTSDTSYHDFMNLQIDWLLGRNPWGTSMFTGIPEGGEYPEDVHTSIMALTGREVAGGLVDGPVYASIYNSLKGISLSEEDEFSQFQNGFVVYHDDIGDYSTNEPTMDGTAGSIIMMAYKAGR